MLLKVESLDFTQIASFIITGSDASLLESTVKETQLQVVVMLEVLVCTINESH